MPHCLFRFFDSKSGCPDADAFFQAIYPAIIIVLVALNSSHMERGLTQNLESVPTPHLALTIDTVAASLRESRLHRTSEVLVIDNSQRFEALRCGDVSDLDSELEDVSRRTGEERIRKAEGVVYSPTAQNA